MRTIGIALAILLAFGAAGCARGGDLPAGAEILVPEATEDIAIQTPHMVFTVTPSPTPPPTPTPSPTPSFAVEELSPEAGYVLGNKVNLRAGPGTDFPKLHSLKHNTVVEIIGKSGDWYEIRNDSAEGFVSGEFLGFGPVPTPKPTPRPYTVERISSKTAYITAKTVNLRKGPGTDFEVIRECLKWDKVTITGKSDNWYRVKCNKKTGYILERYVEIGISPNTVKSAGRFDAADVLLAAQITYRESARGSAEGYKAVASVILNRIRSGKYPGTVHGVVFQGNGAQFSPAEDRERLRLTKPSDACVKAVRDVFENGSILPADVMYFRVATKGTDWADSRTYYNTYGGNCFFS